MTNRLALLMVVLLATIFGLTACGGDGQSDSHQEAEAFVSMMSAEVSPMSTSASTTVTAEMTMDWAEHTFPELFPRETVVHFPAIEYEGVIYNARAYVGVWETSYLGITADGRIFGLGAFTGGVLQQFETIDYWAAQVLADQNGGNSVPSPGEGNPLRVLVNLSSTASLNLIDSAGGEIQLTDAHGNVITLSIPEGAVYEEEISMTLISYLDGATLSGGLIAGIDIQPNGLQLMKPGTLTIELYDPNSIDELLSPDSEYLLTAFAYRGDGSDFHYYPYKIIDDKIVMTIQGFSGYGGGKSNEGDRQSQKEHPPSNSQDRANQEIAEILNEEMRQLALDKNYDASEENRGKLTEILRKWLYESVIPMAEEAETNDAILHCAVIEWLTWESRAQVLEVHDHDTEYTPFTSEINKISSHIRKGYLNALAKSHQRAVSNNDSSQVNTILLLEAETQLLGFEEDFTHYVSEILAKVRRFELEFDSRMIWDGGLYTIGVETETIVLSFSEYDFRYVGTGSVYHVEFYQYCSTSHSLTPGTFHAETFDIPAPPATRPSCDGKTLPKPKPPRIDIGLVISFPGLPVETVTVQCPDADTPFTYSAPLWYGNFGYLHLDIMDILNGFVVTKWDITYGQPYATRTLSKSTDGIIGNTELSLWYAPVP